MPQIGENDNKLSHQDQLNGLQDGWLWSSHALMTMEQLYEFHDNMFKDGCDAMGETSLCGGIGLAIACFPNPPRIACNYAKLANGAIAYGLLLAAKIVFQALDHRFEKRTLGPNQAIYGYEYSRATYLNEKKHYDWNFDALTAISKNILNQHNKMKNQLQKRHN